MLSKIQKQGFVPLKTSITALSAALCWLLLASLPPDARAACNPPYDMNCCVEVQSNECVRMAEFTVTPDDDQCVYFPNNATSLVITAGVSVYRETTGLMKFIVEKVPDPEIPGAICAYAKREWEEDTEGDIVCQWSVTGPTNCPSIPTSGTGFTAQATVCGVGEYIFNFEFAASGQCVSSPPPVSVTVNVLPMPVLSFSPAMIGLDRTDDGPEHKEGTATVTASFCPDAEPYYSWSANAGVCEIPEGQPSEGSDLSSMTYRTPDKEQCSELYMDQTVSVDVSPIGSVSSNLFTVVKVDVEIGGVGEDEEESVGAFVKWESSSPFSMKSDAVSNIWMQSVSITCEPEDMPANEVIIVSASGGDLYYANKRTGYMLSGTGLYANFKANELKDTSFYLVGDEVSTKLKEGIITVTHETSDAVDEAKFTVVGIVVEPIHEDAPEINPSGVGVGETAHYRYDRVEPPELQDAVSWVLTGSSYIASDPSEQEIEVFAGSCEEEFTLELIVDTSRPEFSTYDLPAPRIDARSLFHSYVPVTVWITKYDDGSEAAAEAGQIQGLLDGANNIFRQVAMELHLNGVPQTTNRTDFYKCEYSDLEENLHLDELLDIETYTGGIELYFIKGLYDPLTDEQLGVGGASTEEGVLIASGMGSNIIAHEIGHACGLKDIYTDFGMANNTDVDMPVTGKVSEDRLPRDWGTGYYSENLEQVDLIDRLLMNGFNNGSTDIPLGFVYGTWAQIHYKKVLAIDVPEYEQSLVPVGLECMQTRFPRHPHEFVDEYYVED